MRERRDIPRGFEFALFGTSMLWALCSAVIAGKAAHGIAMRFGLDTLERLLGALFLIFLVVLGFQVLDWIATRRGELADVLPLPRRAGWKTEWGVGAAIGWGLCLAAALPVLLTVNLHAHLRLTPAGSSSGFGGSLASLGISALTLLAATLAEELIARGYGFQRLIAAIGPSWASLLGSVGFAAALAWAEPPRNLLTALVVGTLFGLVLSIGYLRTHALWISWGLHFAYRGVMAMLLGLPIAGHSEFASIAETYTTGPAWLNGGAFGLDGAVLTVAVMLAGIAVLYRATREYAWHYTAPKLVPAGYEVMVAPPAAHVAMEKQAAAPPPLVQILPVTPQSRSVGEEPKP